MNIINKFLCLGISVLSLATMMSCSDDDDNASLTYQNHQYANAYTKQEAQDYIASVNKELFSSSNIDTADFKPFIAACRYFNDTYLSYKTASGEIPFSNIIKNVTTMAGGDLSGLPDLLNKFDSIRGFYQANAVTKTWDKIGKSSYTGWDNIALIFNDQYGVEMVAAIFWSKKDGTNAIRIKDSQGYVVSDTLPSTVGLCIFGGKDTVFLNVLAAVDINNNTIKVNSHVHYGLGISDYRKAPYVITSYSTITDNIIESQTSVSKNENELVNIDVIRNGKNIISGIADGTSYPVAMNKSRMMFNVLNKVLCVQTENTATMQERLKAIKSDGYALGSEELAKAYSDAKNECTESTVSNFNNDYFLFNVSYQSCYDTTLSAWAAMPYFTFNDNTSCSASDFDTTGVFSVSTSAIAELISRLTGFVQSAK